MIDPKFKVLAIGKTIIGMGVQIVFRQYRGEIYGYSVVTGNIIHKNGTLDECRKHFKLMTTGRNPVHRPA